MQHILNKFQQKNIAVIGDLMLDRYIFGDASRISPEAPAPVISVESERAVLGGGGNTANNAAAMGGQVFLIGAIGDDASGEQILKLLKNGKINTDGVFKIKRPTTEKTRVVARSQTIVRMDKEDSSYIDRNLENKIIKFIAANIKNWDGVIVSDYAKGFITENIAKTVTKLSRKYKKPLVVDTKPKHFFFFKGAAVLTPNKKEAESVAGTVFKTTADLKTAGRAIQRKVSANVLVTLGAQGCALFSKNRTAYLPSHAKEVFDVTGAGDTLSAALCLALASGAGILQASKLSNMAAGLAVGKTGTTAVSLGELKLWVASQGIVPNMNMPLPDIVDRFTIALLKTERFTPEQKRREFLLAEEFAAFSAVMNELRKKFPKVTALERELYKINSQVWDLESDIRQGKENKMTLKEVGRRALKIRDINAKRALIRNRIFHETGLGFPDHKVGHVSEVPQIKST